MANCSQNILHDSREIFYDNRQITIGEWVLIIKVPSVEKHAKPVLFGIYWAMPYITNVIIDGKNTHTIGIDEYGRQCCLIYTPHEILIFTDEYSILSEYKLKEYKECGWYMHEINAITTQPLNLEIINEGRSLVEEEREIIWALMLEGLTEQQACEEYFLTHHSNQDNTKICYLPTTKISTKLNNAFGN